MMTEKRSGRVSVSAITRWTVLVLLLGVSAGAFGCGSDAPQSGSATKYPTGISEDIEQQLKYDARVEGFEADGEDLIVNVNDSWLQSPPGMRERALGHWYSMWQPAHKQTSKIVVKHDGNEVESWTAEKGYQPANAEKPTEG